MPTRADVKSPNKNLLSLAKDQEDEKVLDNNMAPSQAAQSTQSRKGKVYKWDFIKMENFFFVKDPVKKMKSQATVLKKLFTKHVISQRTSICNI